MKPYPVLLDIAIMIVAAGLGYRHARKLLAKGRRFDARANAREFPLIAGLGLVFVFGNVGFLWAMNHSRLHWYVPLPLQHYAIPWRLMIDAAIAAFLFGAIVTLASSRRRVLGVVLAAFGMASLVIGEYTSRHGAWFELPELGPPKPAADGVILQTAASTCAAASCANIARHYGIEKTEADMVALLGTTVHGTWESNILYGMEQLGFQCAKRRVPDADFTQLRGPAVLFVAFGTDPLGHAVAYMGYDGEKAEIWNPQSGKRLMTREELSQTWKGHAIEILPGDGQGE